LDNDISIAVQEMMKSMERSENNSNLLREAAEFHGIPSELPVLQQILQRESGGNVGATSPKGAKGLMQLMPETAKALGVKNPFDPRESIFGGVKYYKDMLTQFKGDRALALAAYNAGPKNVRKHKGIPPFAETQKYVKGILNNLGNDLLGILSPSAAHAAEVPNRVADEDDDITKAVRESLGNQAGPVAQGAVEEEDAVTKAVRESLGLNVPMPAPALAPTPAKELRTPASDSDYANILYGQDPLAQPAELPTESAISMGKKPPPPLKNLTTQYHESLLGLMQSVPGYPLPGLPAPGGYDELGNRLDEEGQPIVGPRPNTTWTQALGRLEGLGKDVTRILRDPYSAVVGAAELGWDIGTFGLGLIGATSVAIEHLRPNIWIKMAKGETSVLDAYNIMKDKFQELAEFTEPGKQVMKRVLNSPREAANYLRGLMGLESVEGGPSEAVGEAVMLPLTMTNAWFQGLADEMHKSPYPSPNAEGFLRFLGEATGLFVMAKFHRGGVRGLEKSIHALGGKIQRYLRYSRGPNMDEAWRKLEVLNAAKDVEAEATKIVVEKFEPTKPIVDNVQVVGEAEVKRTEELEAKAEEAEVEEAKAEEAKAEEKKVEVETKPLSAVERARARDAKRKEVEEPKEPEVEPEPEPKPAPKPKVIKTPPKRTLPETDPHMSYFREEDPNVTLTHAKAFEERPPRDLVTLHAEALNNVNRWLDGDNDVPIAAVRNLLSEIAARVEDPANERAMLDMLGSKTEVELIGKITKQSAEWARRIRRKGKAKVEVVEPTPSNINERIEQKPTPPEPKAEVEGTGEVKEVEGVEEIEEAEMGAPLEESWKKAEEEAKVTEETLTQTAIEKYYGKSLDELSDKEIIDYIMKEEGGGIELYSGLPIHQIGKAFRTLFGIEEGAPSSHEDFKLSRGQKLPNGKYSWSVLGLNSNTRKWDNLQTFETRRAARLDSIKRAMDASGKWTQEYRKRFKDPTLQPEAALALKGAERTDRRYDQMEAFKERSFSKWWNSQKKFVSEMIHDQAGGVYKTLLKHFGEAGQKLVATIWSIPGGPRYGEALYRQMEREVYRGLSDNLAKMLDRYHMYMRFIDIWNYKPKWKAPNKIKLEDTIANVARFKELHNLSDEEFKIIKERSNLMFDHVRHWIDKFLAETGIISTEEAKALKSHDYSKMKYLDTYADIYDSITKNKVGGIKTTNFDSGIDPLKGGGAELAEVDQRIVYNEVARRLAGRAANQRAKQAMMNFATEFPDNGMVWHKGLGGKRPKGWIRDSVWTLEGVESAETNYPSRQPIWLHPDFAHQVNTVGHDMSNRFLWATKLLAVDLVRALVVGSSAVWATMAGFPIDVMHTFFSPRIFKNKNELGTQAKAEAIYSPFFPKYLAELKNNFANVASDLWHAGPMLDAYGKYGGLMSFITQRQSHITGLTHRPGKGAKVLDILSAHGKNMELLVRMAIMDRVVEQKAGELGITREELWKKELARPESEILRLATHVARENMPYGQTGWLTRALDRFIVFLGANYVADRTFWRAPVERPKDFAIRVANIGAAAVGITALSLLYDPKAWSEIPDDKRRRNAVIPFFPNYLNFIGSKGQERSWYMKIPGAGGPMFFYNLFSGLTHKLMYETGMTTIRPNYEAIAGSLTQSTAVRMTLPPAIAGVVSYVTNHSSWKNDAIFKELGGKSFWFPMSKVEGMYDPNVSQLAKHIGGITGLSPKRLEGASSEIIPRNNEFIWVFSRAYEGLLSSLPKKLLDRTWQEVITSVPGFNRWFGLTMPAAYRQMGDEARWRQEAREDEKNYLRRDEFNLIMEEKARGGDVREKLKDFYAKVGKEDPEALDRFLNDTIKLSMIETMKHRDVWKEMLGKSDKLKAADFHERYKTEASPEERKSLNKELGRLMVADFIGEGFFEELGKLRREDQK